MPARKTSPSARKPAGATKKAAPAAREQAGATKKATPVARKRTAVRKATPVAKKRAGARDTAARSFVLRGPSFQEGDVVVDAGMPSRVGTVCGIVTPSRSYRVRFADDTQCVHAPHSALALAPAGTQGPACDC